MRLTVCLLAVSLLRAHYGWAQQEKPPQAPDLFRVRVETTKGVMLWEFHRSWSPHGVDHFYQLVRSGYYDGDRFFRVIAGRWAQFGINGDPKIANEWRSKSIPDDPRVESNVRGTIAYAFAVPNGRTTQLFINLRDNRATHDKEPFVPIGRVVEGMDVADALYSGYGEKAGGGIRAGHQDAMFEGGNAYFDTNFPSLDQIKRTTIIGKQEASGNVDSASAQHGVFAEEGFKVAPPLTRLFALDAYTEYDLLDDANSNSFRIVFMPVETRPGATHLINETRHGSDGGGIEVYDPRTGNPLKFEYLPGTEMMGRKIPGSFSPEDHYIWVELPHPVPRGGEGRVLIYKTYKDARTYYPEGDGIVWTRPLSAQRFGIILPRAYSLVSSNIAAQIMTTSDGRLKLSLANPSGGGSPITIRASKTTATFAGHEEADKAADDTKTLYDLDAPDSHLFKIEQTYSERHKGKAVKLPMAEYAKGIANLTVTDLDTAETLPVENGTVKLPLPIENDRQSAHLKVGGSVRDSSYRLDRDELVFEGTLHGLRNTILLPAGWELSAVSQPANAGNYRGRSFVALVNIEGKDSSGLVIRARHKR